MPARVNTIILDIKVYAVPASSPLSSYWVSAMGNVLVSAGENHGVLGRKGLHVYVEGHTLHQCTS